MRSFAAFVLAALSTASCAHAGMRIEYDREAYIARGPDHIPGTPVRGSLRDESERLAKQPGPWRSLQATEVVFSGLQYPTGITWDPAHDNIVIVSEKQGILKKFNGWRGAGGQVLVDISAQVASYGDHGLTSVVYLNNYLWVTYMLINPEFGNNCNDYGQFDGGRQNKDVKGCKVTGRYSRFPYDPAAGVITGPEQVVIEGATNDMICGQFSTHGTTNSVIGPGGLLYLAIGDGAAFTAPDGGQLGDNPCNDPPEYPGAFRCQNPNRYSGKILTVNPISLEVQIYATGFRNPWRMSMGQTRLYESETGWYTWEEINIVEQGKNYGWPCYEGPEAQVDYQFMGNPVCQWLQDTNSWVRPFVSYKHPPNAIGNVQSVSGVLEYGQFVYYGDYTQRLIRRVDLNGQNEQTVALGVSPVGIYNTPTGPIFVDYDTFSIRMLPIADDVVLPTPSSSRLPPFVNIAMQQDSWAPAQGTLAYKASSNVEGREGVQWYSNATLTFNCDANDNCDAYSIPTDHGTSLISIPAPEVDGTIEVLFQATTFTGAGAIGRAWQKSVAEPAECRCSGSRTYLTLSELYTRPRTGTSRPSTPITKTTGFLAGVISAAAVVGVLLLLAVAWFAGLGQKCRRSEEGAGAPTAAAAGGAPAAPAESSIQARRSSFAGAPGVDTGVPRMPGSATLTANPDVQSGSATAADATPNIVTVVK